MRKYNKLRANTNIVIDNKKKALTTTESHLEKSIATNKNLLEKIENIENVINEIDEEFAKKTSIINPKDQIFLWTAVALQTVRWILQPAFDTSDPDKANRTDASDGASQENKDNTNKKREIEEKQKKKNKNDNNDKTKEEKLGNVKMLKWQEYFTNPVPYDAMNGNGAKELVIDGITEKDKNLCGKNHHSATLGHDPVLGYVFGTINIMTSTITFNNKTLSTNNVENNKINETVGFIPAFNAAIVSESREHMRLGAAVARQAIHMKSDKDTHMGLPIPFLSAEKAQELLNKGWNSNELKRVAKDVTKKTSIQFVIANFINTIISTLHFLMYDEKKDESMDLYKVRTKRILAVSNSIAEALNIVYVGGSVVVGVVSENATLVKKGLSKIDLGGYIEAVHQIVTSKKLQEKIRREYLNSRLDEELLGENFDFLNDNVKGESNYE